jgi:hypothetical protein
VKTQLTQLFVLINNPCSRDTNTGFGLGGFCFAGCHLH